MARKSNKTAHVLNLLSGQPDAGGEAEKEAQQLSESQSAAPAEEKAPAEPAPAKEQPAPAPAPSPEVPPNISIIDSKAKEDDPIAERIREDLLKELELEESPIPQPEAVTVPKSATVPEAAAAPESVTVPEATATSEPATVPEPEAAISEPVAAPEPEVTVPEPKPAAASEPAAPIPPAPSEPEEEIPELSPEPPVEPEPPKEPEPDYVMLNVMQRVVEDKIIYFMKQFEVCTCARCKADTIALTLSGLPAKYKIVDKHAVDPLVSYYTSRLISQVTVEALKACTQVRDNPRHEPQENTSEQ